MQSYDMNEFQTTLYTDLAYLVETNEAFFCSDQYYNDTHYKIFNYRLASYSNFLLPGALECRGVMFEMDSNGGVVKLASLPLHKFFNLNENPSTMDLDISTIKRIMVKSDGSLISSYMHGDCLRLKSKGSLASDQAIAAMEWIEQHDHNDFKQKVLHYTKNHHTVVMEWVGPDNRIVLGYEKPQLIVLHVRNNENGTYRQNISTVFAGYMPDELPTDKPYTFIESIPEMQDNIEGFVCILENDKWFKIKTNKYLALHKTKDSVNCPRRLFEAVIEEATDDMRSLFVEDPQALELIGDMEEFVDYHYNHMVNNVEVFFASYEQLDRKSYAIRAKADLDSKEFGLAMGLYLGRKVDYKAVMKKNWKSYGIQNEPTEDTE